MRIVYCIASICNAGGKDRVVVTKANALAALGIEVFIITTDQKQAPSFFALHPQIVHHDLKINYEDSNSHSILNRWKTKQSKKKVHKEKLSHYLKGIRPDIVISTFEEDASIIASIRGSFIKLMELHYSKERRYNEYTRSKFSAARILDFLRTRYDEYIVSQYDYLVALTETDKKKWWVIKNKSSIPNPLSWEPISSPSALTTPKVLAVGRYSSEKNFEELIDIWALVISQGSKWQLEIIGLGYLKTRLEQKISELGLNEYITLTPPSSQILEKYKDASLLVVTSKYEGFGMVLIEAMSCGLPVISYDCPYGPREIISHGIDGFLVPLGDKHTFAKHLLETITNQEARKSLGAHALRSSQRYSQNKIIKQWVNLFSHLIDKHSSTKSVFISK